MYEEINSWHAVRNNEIQRQEVGWYILSAERKAKAKQPQNKQTNKQKTYQPLISTQQIKTTERYHFISARMSIIKKDGQEQVSTTWRNWNAYTLLSRCKMVQLLWKTESSQKVKRRVSTWSNNRTSRCARKRNENILSAQKTVCTCP